MARRLPRASREPNAATTRDVLLTGQLRSALERLNLSLPTEAVEEAFRKVVNLPHLHPGLEANKRAFHKMLSSLLAYHNGNLKFLSYVGADGYRVFIPAIQTQSLDGQHVLFSPSVYADELQAIPAGIPLAVFGMALTMEDVLLCGTYRGIRRVGGVKAGVVEVEWIYNPMPPVPGQVYPPVGLQAVTEF